MIAFLLAACLLILAVLGLLLSPQVPRPQCRRAPVRRRDANLAIFREQRADLERDRNSGRISEIIFLESQEEIQRRLLEETREREEWPEAAEFPNHRYALPLVFFIPLAALLIYMGRESPNAFGLSSNALPAVSLCPQRSLDTALNDADAWILRARVCRALGRFQEAAEAFAQAETWIEPHAAWLADYAETLLQLNGGRYDQKIDALLKRAIENDAHAPKALFLAGASAAERGEFQRAVEYWERLLPQLDPASKEAGALKKAIAQLRKLAAKAAKTMPKHSEDSRSQNMVSRIEKE